MVLKAVLWQQFTFKSKNKKYLNLHLIKPAGIEIAVKSLYEV